MGNPTALREGSGSLEDRCLKELRKRALPGGGFADKTTGRYRTDSTAWAVIALGAAAGGGADEEILRSSRARLAKDQLPDGRIGLLPDHPESFWSTPLAVLAWQGSREHAEQRRRAEAFLLRTTGLSWPRTPGQPSDHDTSIRGWPWIENTYSWNDPTSLSVTALKLSGHGDHPRVLEAVRMLLDRQLPSGGWNYGNTKVFGTELHPLPDSTGLALNALAGSVAAASVERSLSYLEYRIREIRSPLSLCWGILGLGAWKRRPAGYLQWLEQSWGLQGRYGDYSTSLVSMMILASVAPSGLWSIKTEMNP